MICERCTAPQAVKNKMAALLEETFYVPVLRAEDGCTLPVIGEPFSPTTPPVSVFDYNKELGTNLLYVFNIHVRETFLTLNT